MATISEDYVSFETAKLLKDKGFDTAVRHYYQKIDDDITYHIGDFRNWNVYDMWYSMPTLQMAMKWLREVYDFNIEIDTIGRKDKETLRWRSVIYNLNNQCECYYNENCDSYEQACEAAIKYCLENLI